MKKREKPSKCDFYGCPNTKANTNNKLVFHRFPASASRCEKWAESCHMINLVTADSLVCSDHFEPSSFPYANKSSSKLVWNANPTIPARNDNKERFPKNNETCIVVYPMTQDWGSFLCRLCTQPISVLQAESASTSQNYGVHIFGEEARKLKLKEKINMYLPQPVELEDSLPKFVCRFCIQRVLDTADTVNAFRDADCKLRAEVKTKGHLQDLEAPNLKAKFTPSILPYKCTKCGHLFLDINSLLCHELDHVKPTISTIKTEDITTEQQLTFQCNDCPLSFLSHHSLSLHASQHHCSVSHSDSLVSLLLDRIEEYEEPESNPIPCIERNIRVLEINSENEVKSIKCFGQNITTVNTENCEVLNKTVSIEIKLESKTNENINKITSNTMKSNENKSKPNLKSKKVDSRIKNNNKITTKVSKNNEIKLKTNKYNTRSISTKIETQFIQVPNYNITYECSECIEKFIDINLFKKHLNVHKDKQRSVCKHCYKSFTISGLKLHLKRLKKEKNKNEYICDLCKKVFKDRHYLVMHIKNTHSENRLQCSKCPRNFKSREGLQGHLMRHEGIYSFLCDICGSKFLTHSAMRIHRRRHTQQNFFTCHVCGKKIQEHNRFQDHLRTHTGETPFGCEKCERRFHSKKLLKQHMQIHNNIRPHTCPLCNMSFKRVGNLKQHLVRHDNYRPICSICRVTFDSCEERNEHRRTHTIEEREEAKIARMKPRGPKRNRNQFLCKVCKTVFNSKEEKAKHLLQNPDHVNSIKCTNCDQTFRSIQSLSVHQRVHTGERPYSCSICLKSFRTYATCRQHTQVHSNESKFKCDICDRTFNRLYTLNVHKRSHSNERPFSCTTCGRGFKQKQDMKKHMKLHLIKESNNSTNDNNIIISNNTRMHHHDSNKWIIDDDLGVNLNQSLQETITIPAEMHTDLNFTQSNLLTSSNIVITVPFVHTSDPQAYFSM